MPLEEIRNKYASRFEHPVSVSIIFILLWVIFLWFIGPENKLSSYVTKMNYPVKAELPWNLCGIQHLCRAPATPPAQLELVCFPGQELGGQSKTVTASEVIHHRKRMWKISDNQFWLMRTLRFPFFSLYYNLGHRGRNRDAFW